MRSKKNGFSSNFDSIGKLIGLITVGYFLVKLFEEDKQQKDNSELEDFGSPGSDEPGGDGGNPKAKEQNGIGQFKYSVFEQVFNDFGFACKASSVISVYKSLGLIAPKALRKELEKKNLEAENLSEYKDTKNIDIKIPIFPKNLNRSLRGIKNYAMLNGKKVESISINNRLKLTDILKSANDLAVHSEYAKQKEMAGKKFKLIYLNSVTEIVKQIEKGFVVRVYLNTDHFVTLTTVVRDETGNVDYFIADDNLYGGRAKYALSNVLTSTGDPERQAFSIEPISILQKRN